VCCVIRSLGHPIERTPIIEVLRRSLEFAQYTSAQLADVAAEVRLWVGRTGVCWDNAQQESF